MLSVSELHGMVAVGARLSPMGMRNSNGKQVVPRWTRMNDPTPKTRRMSENRGLVGRKCEYKPSASVPSMRAEPNGPHAKARLWNSAVSRPRQVWSRAEAARRRPIQGKLNLAVMGPCKQHKMHNNIRVVHLLNGRVGNLVCFGNSNEPNGWEMQIMSAGPVNKACCPRRSELIDTAGGPLPYIHTRHADFSSAS